MKLPALRLAMLLGTLGIAAAPALAGSASSAASSAGSASVGSLSDSLRGSSRSSSSAADVAAGDWRVVELVALDERPGMLRLRMQPGDGPHGAPAEAGELALELPAQALAPHGLARGEVVRVRHRPYGIELARAATREPFLLLLDDDWRHELDTRRVRL